MEPEVGWTNPQITLKSVVLPAPFGPMTPTTSSLPTDIDTSSRANSPPNPMLI